MASVRELLECLGRDGLVRLMRERGLPPTRENDDRRSCLARSFRGDVSGFISELTREELVSIFRSSTFEVRGDEAYLSNPSKYRLDELRAFALNAFAGLDVRTPGEFCSVPTPSEDELELQVGEQEECVSDLDIGSLGRVSEEWSRPRLISRLLRHMGRKVPSRLRTVRFHELLADLAARGIEACLSDDPEDSPLGDGTESPGISAKLRLRLRLPKASNSRALADRGIGPRGPAIVIDGAEPPLVQSSHRPSDYELAVLRLKFLTAIPSTRRSATPQWPSAFLDAATRGLQLRLGEPGLLRAISASVSIGNHSPYDSIQELVRALSEREWDELLEDLQALNPSQPGVVAAIAQQVRAILTSQRASSSEAPHMPPEDLRVSLAAPAEPLVASGKPSVAVEPPSPSKTNVRDLGSLSGMFGDE